MSGHSTLWRSCAPLVTLGLVGLLLAACAKKETAPPEPEAPPKPTLEELLAPNAPKAGTTAPAPALPKVDRGEKAEPLHVAVSTPRGAVRGEPRPTMVIWPPASSTSTGAI